MSLESKSERSSPDILTSTRVFWFWLPLAAMWLVMGVEHPLFTAFIARLPGANENLAAFGISFSLGVIIEAPAIMLLTAGTALAGNRHNYRLLLRFTHILVLGLTSVHLLVAVTPLFDLIVGRVIGAPQEVWQPSRRAFLLLTPWCAAIAYRRLWQGVLIRFRKTILIPLTMIIRLSIVFALLMIGYALKLPGASLACAALSIGVISAAVAAYLFARPLIRHLSVVSLNEQTLSWSGLLSFYIPLALTSMMSLSAQPLLSIGLARAAHPLESLAVWPVLTGLLFLVRSLAIASQEVVVALSGDRDGFRALRKFTLLVSAALTILLASIAFTPLSRLWFAHVAGLKSDLLSFTAIPIMVLFIIPGLDTFMAWNRGLLVHLKRTPIISQAVGLNLVVLITVMFAGAAVLQLNGAVLASIALASALSVECLYLALRRRRVGTIFVDIDRTIEKKGSSS